MQHVVEEVAAGVPTTSTKIARKSAASGTDTAGGMTSRSGSFG
jgi:hypothetical protein